MNILVTAALAFFFAVGLGLAAAGGIRAAWRGLGRRRGVSAALAAFAVVATICAQKPSGPAITVDALLRDAGCYATNDVFHAAVSNAPAYAAIDFSTCPVLVYARERGQTNAADWAELTPRRTFSELPADYAIANATSYNYMVYLDYVPPSPVHTNGVFELHGFMVPGDESEDLEQFAAGFINSIAIPPPYDAEVEYLEADNNGLSQGSKARCVIDTGIVPNLSTDVWECDAQFVQFGQAAGCWGVTGNRFAFGRGSNSWKDWYFGYGNTNNRTGDTYDNLRHVFKLDGPNRRFFVDSATYNGSGTIVSGSSRSVAIFNRNNPDGVDSLLDNSKSRCYSSKYYRNGTLIQHLVPVRKNGIGYLYDRVSGQLFGNAGTGAFIVGPDK